MIRGYGWWWCPLTPLSSVPASIFVAQRMHHWRQSFSPRRESVHDLGISCLRQVLLCVLAGIRKMEENDLQLQF